MAYKDAVPTASQFVIPFFRAGLYVNRQPLFSALVNIGIQIAQFHDALLDGINIEVTDRLTLQRRPAFTKYCGVPLQPDEVAVEYYSVRNSVGTITTFLDTNQNFYIMTPFSLTPLNGGKSPGAGRTSVLQVGDLTYICDGVDAYIWDGIQTHPWGVAAPTVAPLLQSSLVSPGFWNPKTSYPLEGTQGGILLDNLGNIETVTTPGVSGPLLPIWSPILGNSTNDGTVIWEQLGPIASWIAGAAYTVPFVIVDSNNNVESCTSPGTAGTTVPTWNTTVGGTTTDGGVTWTNLGAGLVIAFAGWTYTYAFRTVSGNLSTASPFSQNTSPILRSATLSPITITSYSIAGALVSFKAGQTLQAGESITLNGFPTSTFFNGQTYVVNASPTATSFTVNSSLPNSPGTVLEVGYAYPVIVSVLGLGTDNPDCNSTATITEVSVLDNIVTLTGANNFVPGLAIGLSGFTNASFLNGQTVYVSETNAVPGTLATNFTAYFVTPDYSAMADNGTATFLAVEIYRTADGGGIPYFDGAALNPGVTPPLSTVFSGVAGHGADISVPGAASWSNPGNVTSALSFASVSEMPPLVSGGTPNFNIVQSGSATASGTTVTFTFAHPVTAGNNFVISFGSSLVAGSFPAVSSVADTFGNSYASQSHSSGTYESDPGGAIESNSLTDPPNGFGYSVGQTVGLPGGTGGTVRVDSLISGGPYNGAVGSYTLLTPGSGYNVGTSVFIDIDSVSSPTSYLYDLWLYTAPSGTSGSNTITVVLSESSNLQLICHEVSGMIDTLDVQNSAGIAVAPTTFNTGSITTTNAVDVVFSVIFLAATSGPVRPSSYTNGAGSTASGSFVYAAYEIATHTGTYPASWSCPAGNGAAIGVTAAFKLTLFNTGSDLLQATKFNFSIPGNVTPQGITITFDAEYNGAEGLGTIYAQLLKNGAAVGTPLSVKPTPLLSPPSGITYTLGGASNLWGTFWSFLDFNNSTWGVQFTASLQNQAGGPFTTSIRNVKASVNGAASLLYWAFNDISTDAELDDLQVAELAHENDPPPGQPGSTGTTGVNLLAYWSNRIFSAAGNDLYFDGGPDILNGVPEECFPPANVWTFPGEITGLEPSTGGLIVTTGKEYWAIMGGPATLTYFPERVFGNFGVLTPNCIEQDGDNIYTYSTQKQVMNLSGANKNYIGLNISPLFAHGQFTSSATVTPFDPAKSYIVMHRNGDDAAVYVSNGVESLLRYSLNILSWSPVHQPLLGIAGSPPTPVASVGAIGSIETAPGIFSFLAAPATGGGYVYERNLGVFAEDGVNAYPANAVIGNIVVSDPGAKLIPLHYISAYCMNVGKIPKVSILPNEIFASGTTQFTTLPVAQPEPAFVPVTKTIMGTRWPVLMNEKGTPLQIRHVQIKIDFGLDTVKNELLVVGLKFNLESEL